MTGGKMHDQAEAIEHEVDIFEEYEEILQDYKRRESLRNLLGLSASVLVHLLLILLGFYVIVIDQPRSEASITAESVAMDVKDIQDIPPVQRDDNKQIEEGVDKLMPKVSRPEPPSEAADPVEDIPDDPAALDDPIALGPGPFDTIPGPHVRPKPPGTRTEDERDETRTDFEIDESTEEAVLKALRWLKEHQQEGGYWLKKNNIEGDAMSGLALLAFLAHGDVPSSSAEFGLTVQKAIDYLVRRVETAGSSHLGKAYTQGIVAYALAEAYAMTMLPEVGYAAKQALQVVLDGQQAGGGYNYRYEKGNRWDLSVASWQLQTMKAATVAGIELPGLDEAKNKGVDWLKNTAYRNGAFGYSSPGGNRISMSSAGALALQLLDQGDSEQAKATLERLLIPYQTKWEKVNHHSAYSWYYLAQAIFHSGRRPFKQFFPGFSKMLKSHQADDGHWRSPGKEDHDVLNRDVYMSTALNCLSLQVAYRYLPSYKATIQRTTSSEQANRKADDDDDVFNLDDSDLGIQVN